MIHKVFEGMVSLTISQRKPIAGHFFVVNMPYEWTMGNSIRRIT